MASKPSQPSPPAPPRLSALRRTPANRRALRPFRLTIRAVTTEALDVVERDLDHAGSGHGAAVDSQKCGTANGTNRIQDSSGQSTAEQACSQTTKSNANVSLALGNAMASPPHGDRDASDQEAERPVAVTASDWSAETMYNDPE
jgi:hypothetical protein